MKFTRKITRFLYNFLTESCQDDSSPENAVSFDQNMG